MAVFLEYAWLIPLFPLLAAALITFPPIRQQRSLSCWLAIGCMILATIFALGLLSGVAQGMVLHPVESVSAITHTDDHADTPTDDHADDHGSAYDTSFTFPDANVVQRIAWAPTGSSAFHMGIYIDPIVAVVLAMVTITSTCIHLFSLGYMSAHPSQARFFSFISLFTAGMLGMTMAGDLLLFFMCWEIMGLCSYLLIGFLYERPTAYRAGLKAFITTRIGDVLMLIGMVYLYTIAGTLEFGTGPGQIFHPPLLEELAHGSSIFGSNHATVISLLLFCGTIGKSAQLPLHVWLPDAMEGPTPVSALIHAATMVSAGVFLVGRIYPILDADQGTALLVVAMIGSLTAFVAATIAVAQFDIKRILAYSTLSQLGFMVAALGIGGWMAGMFHLLTHAFFKALLFLGSGSIIHAMEATPAIEKLHHKDEYAAQQTAQDIRNMGGLREYMPVTFWTYTAGYLALAGIVPFAGFWSKDEILADAWSHGEWFVYILLTLASFLTAFYMSRQWFTVFFGTYRGDNPIEFVNPEPAASHGAHHAHDDHAHDDHAHASHSGHGGKPHESPWSMTLPLIILAVFATIGGFFNLPFSMPGGHWLSDLLGQHAAEFNPIVAALALTIAGIGIWAGSRYATAFQTAHDADPLQTWQPNLFSILHRKYMVDEFYTATVGALTPVIAATWRWLDQQVIDRIVVGVGNATLFLGRVNFIVDDTLFNDGPDGLAEGTVMSGDGLRQAQTGKAQDYGGYIFMGVVALAVIYLYWIP